MGQGIAGMLSPAEKKKFRYSVRLGFVGKDAEHFFTSEEIGKHVLSYDPIPLEYQGCIPLSDVGNRWSL